MTHRRHLLGLMGSLPFLTIGDAFGQAPSPAQPASARTATPTPPSPLAPVNALPAGLPLATLAPLANTSTQPGLFRATLTAAPTRVPMLQAHPTEFWAYNASVPGPLIDVTEGDTVEILFINQLSQPSTIHWHGLPVPSEQDGNPQDAVAPGGQRLYRFTLLEGCAGTYWYHPHPHGHTAEQVYRGLAGGFIVRPKSDPLHGIPERLLLFSDLKLQQDGRIASNSANDEMNGREGQFALVNGQRQPRLKFAPGGRERWRIWNANSARYLRLNLAGQRFALVGTDGGLLERPLFDLDELLLAPAQRVELVVDAPAQGGSFGLWAAPYQRGKMGKVMPEQALKLLQVDFGVPPVSALLALPTALRRIAALGAPMAKKRVLFTEEMSMADGVHRMNFLVNGKTFHMNRIDLTSKQGEVELWEIVNESDMDHPFHIHGTQFQVQDSTLGGQLTPAPVLAWRDTVNLKAGESVRLKMVQAFKGPRLFHCHILEHENAGMMGQLMVV